MPYVDGLFAHLPVIFKKNTVKMIWFISVAQLHFFWLFGISVNFIVYEQKFIFTSRESSVSID